MISSTPGAQKTTCGRLNKSARFDIIKKKQELIEWHSETAYMISEEGGADPRRCRAEVLRFEPVGAEVVERPREAVGGQSDNTLADTQCFAR